jgi:hypothetical protein
MNSKLSLNDKIAFACRFLSDEQVTSSWKQSDNINLSHFFNLNFSINSWKIIWKLYGDKWSKKEIFKDSSWQELTVIFTELT